MKHKPLLCHRRGYLMFDMLVVMTLTIVVLSTMSIWVYKTMQYYSQVRQRNLHSQNIARIGRQLRTDTREADSISISDKTVEITTNDRNIIYAVKSNTIHRKAAGGEKNHHDDFEFAKNAVLTWKQGSNDEVAFLNIRRDFSKLAADKGSASRPMDAQIRISVKRKEAK